MDYKIYLPDLITDEQYVSILDKDTIRVFHNEPIQDNLVNYTDYYINSHYLKKEGSLVINETFNFVDKTLITDNVWYRNDLPGIMITFGIFLFTVVSFMLFIAKSFFKGFLK